jgi:two-component system, OmpR family, sensor histidine kinase KdpD
VIRSQKDRGMVPQMARTDRRDERIQRAGIRLRVRSILRALPSSIVVVIVSFICYAFHLSFPTMSFFLVVVVLQSLGGDFLSSAVVSVISFLCLNFFFVAPIFSLRVSDPSDTLALISFLITGLVITRLTSQARAAADSEKLHRTETTRLYELARQLL